MKSIIYLYEKTYTSPILQSQVENSLFFVEKNKLYYCIFFCQDIRYRSVVSSSTQINSDSQFLFCEWVEKSS